MKQFILLLSLLFSINSSAQITIDKVEDNGTRIIITKDYHLYTGLLNGGSLRLGYGNNNDVEQYWIILNLTEGRSISKERKLLIKLVDGSTLELQNTEDVYFDYSKRMVCPNYRITEDEIKILIEGQVVKIRIDNDLDYLDRNIAKNRFSKGLKEAFEAIQKRKEIKNDLYEGF